ncbi:hypothetical protein KP509_24G018500 [Ceratopteris richardii]|uniref:Uncharacterized protein n=1 Tax=Ceratopteris richardii TaxID=49495 RepID=A0A8T2RVJ9_CERRI|nr:hypothetical protein KP509_24G018500 [Ceratopteris richardii]
MEENLKDDHVKAEKHREEGITNLKSKHDRRRGELEHEDASRNKEDSTIDVGSDGRARKRGEREPDYGARYSKRYGEGSLEKRHDDKEAGEKQKIDMSMRESQHVNGKQLDQLVKYEKMHDGNDREKDAWAPSERSGREKPKDEGSRHSRRRDESQERRWGATTQDERTKTNKDPYERQKHSRDEDERQRYSAFNAGKQRGERVKDERKQVERLKDDRHDDTNIPVFERLGVSKDTNRRPDAVEKESRRASLDRTYDQFGKKNKDQDEQVKVKGPRDAGDLRENKGHASAKGDRPTSKASRSTLLQDQERIFSVSGAKDAASSENVLKRSVESDIFDPSVDRDFTRVHGRQAEELLHEKSGRKSKFEPSLSSGSGSRRPRDQSWHPGIHGDQVISFLGPDEEVRSWDPKGACQDSDDERRRLYGHERVRDTSSPRAHHGRASDDFGRVSEATQLKDSAMSKRKHESFSQSAAGSIKHRRTDDVLIERSDWSHQGSQANRAPTDGPMGRSLPSNRHLGSSALLPPPPPYRPGVDNPAVMSAPGNFVEGSNARDGGRYERKTGGHSRRPEMVGPGDTWAGFGIGYPHGQGPVPGPGGLFPSFPQMGPGFLGMGQQFHGPQVFGPNGPRPMNMGFGGRFRSGDGSSCFPVHAADHGPTMGWHRYPDGNENHRPLGGLMHGWEGAGRYADDRQRFGHSDWDQFSQGITGGWDGMSEGWQNQAGNAGYDASSMHRQRDELYQARLGEDVWPGNDTGKVEPVEDNIPKSPEETVVHTASLPDKFSSKASRRFKERLQALLLHAEIDANLVDADLYKEYLSCLPSVEAKKREAVVDGHKDVAALFVDADLEFEADSDAQDLLKETSSTTILPPFTHNAYELCNPCIFHLGGDAEKGRLK